VDVSADDGANVVHGEHVVGRADGDHGRAVLPTDCEGVVPTRELLGEERCGGGVQRVAVEVDVFQSDFAGEGARFVDFGFRRRDTAASRLLCRTHRCHLASRSERHPTAPSRAADLQLRLPTYPPLGLGGFTVTTVVSARSERSSRHTLYANHRHRAPKM
jgi:hypothetical protein